MEVTMSPEHAPEDFDWVAAQANCTAASMFARLLAGVREDVQRRNGLLGRDDGWKFELHQENAGFEVSRVVSGFTGTKVDAFVTFERAGRRLHIRGDNVDVDITAIVALDAAGACRLVVGEAMYAEWEIRRLALEQLFFEDAEAEE